MGQSWMTSLVVVWTRADACASVRVCACARVRVCACVKCARVRVRRVCKSRVKYRTQVDKMPITTD